MKEKTLDNRAKEVTDIMYKYHSFSTYFKKQIEKTERSNLVLSVYFKIHEHQSINFWFLERLANAGYDNISIKNYDNAGYNKHDYFILEVVLRKRKVIKIKKDKQNQVVTFASLIQ